MYYYVETQSLDKARNHRTKSTYEECCDLIKKSRKQLSAWKNDDLCVKRDKSEALTLTFVVRSERELECY